MSPVAPMPHGAPVGTNGLKVWVMVDSGELSMTSCLPVVAAPVVELELPELDPLDEHAASPAASKPAAPTAKSRLGLLNLLINLVFLSCSAWVSLDGCMSTSRQLRDQFRGGYVQAPAGRTSRGRAGQEGRVLLPAAVLGERAPGTERAAGLCHLLRRLRSAGPGRSRAPGPVGPAAQRAAEV